jgi:P27 family predicted phage terminase small subunit
MKKIPRAPQHLSDEMKDLWKAILRDLDLEPDALVTFRAACEQWDRAQQARELINRDGLMLNGKAHPALTAEKNAYQNYLRCMRALGLDVVQAGQPAGKKR